MNGFLDSWQRRDDRRAVFLTCYSMMTSNMLVALEAGEFQDPAWVQALLDRFADYYFDALYAYDTGVVAPSTIWHFTFDSTQTSNLHVLQHLLLGVNAHICYDLVFALVDQMADWQSLTESQRAVRYRDHCHVNDIIFRTINRVQDDVIKRYCATMGMVDEWMGTVDEWLLHRMIVEWRDEVWNFATQLLGCTDEPAANEVRQQVEERTLNRAAAIAGQRGLAGLAAIF